MSEKRGIGFIDLLAILFIGLKLAGIISWSWVWVVSPIWIPIMIIVVYAIIDNILNLVFKSEEEDA